jgi:hypothetical protein
VEAVRTFIDDAAIRRYLLGLMPEAEADGLEEEFLSTPEVWERVRGVENDLLDDYAAGHLPAPEQNAFERRYLASPRLRERVRAARALRLAAPAASAKATSVARSRAARPGWLALAATLLLAAVLIWRGPSSTEQVATTASPAATPLPAPSTPVSAAAPAPPTPSVAPGAREIVLALAPVLLRGEGRPRELRLGAAGAVVRLELEGDPAMLPARPGRLEAVIETVEGQPVWRGEADRPAGERARPSLLAAAVVPVAALAPGDYLVTLSAAGAPEGVVHRYYFRAR